MTPELFCELAENVRQYLENLSHTNPAEIAACRSGEDFEVCVRDAISAVLSRDGIDAEIQYEQGSHVFPDIVLKFENGDKYGVEVKSSTGTGRSWKINGNSVLGSTKEDVIDTYVMFGKTTMGHQAFRCKRYEECVADVAVTHSPRYRIDMELEPGTTFFEKSGLSYQRISSAEKPIELITDYFRAQGQKAWWLSESTPAVIRMFSDLSSEEQAELIGFCFAHFPEIFSNSSKKFHRCAIWLVTERSVVAPCLRDSFTAGGRVDIPLYGATYENVPQIFNNLRTYRSYIVDAIENASIDELREDWGYTGVIEDSLHARIAAWVSVTAEKFTGKSVNNYDRVRMLSDMIMT